MHVLTFADGFQRRIHRARAKAHGVRLAVLRRATQGMHLTCPVIFSTAICSLSSYPSQHCSFITLSMKRRWLSHADTMTHRSTTTSSPPSPASPTLVPPPTPGPSSRRSSPPRLATSLLSTATRMVRPSPRPRSVARRPSRSRVRMESRPPRR